MSKEFKLPKGKVTVRPLIKSTFLIPDTNHRSAFLAPGAKNRYVPPVLRDSGQFKNILTDAEKIFFESTAAGMDFKQGDLSIYKKQDNYWDTYSLLLGKEELTLDLNNPVDYIKYKVLLANSEEIAPSLESYRKTKRATYKYVLIDKEEEVRASSVAADMEEEAWSNFGEIKNDRTKMIDVLRVYGKKPSDTSSDAFLKDAIKKVLKDDTKGFLEVVTDPNLEMKITIERAVKAGLISSRAGAYTLSGGQKLGASLYETAVFLNTPENQDVLISIETKLENADK